MMCVSKKKEEEIKKRTEQRWSVFGRMNVVFKVWICLFFEKKAFDRSVLPV